MKAVVNILLILYVYSFSDIILNEERDLIKHDIISRSVSKLNFFGNGYKIRYDGCTIVSIEFISNKKDFYRKLELLKRKHGMFIRDYNDNKYIEKWISIQTDFSIVIVQTDLKTIVTYSLF